MSAAERIAAAAGRELERLRRARERALWTLRILRAELRRLEAARRG